MDWHDIIFVVHDSASKMSETERPRIYDIREVPVPGHALGHFLPLNLKEITAYSTRCHDSADWSEVARAHKKKKENSEIKSWSGKCNVQSAITLNGMGF